MKETHFIFNPAQNHIAVFAEHIRLLGAHKALFISQCNNYTSWRRNHFLKNGIEFVDNKIWFYKSRDEFLEEGGYTARTLSRTISFFKKHKVLDVTYRQSNRRFYRLNYEKLGELLDALKKEEVASELVPAVDDKFQIPKKVIHVEMYPIYLNNKYYNELLFDPDKYIECTNNDLDAKVTFRLNDEQNSLSTRQNGDTYTPIRRLHSYYTYIQHKDIYTTTIVRNMYNYIIRILSNVTGVSISPASNTQLTLTATQLKDFYQKLLIVAPARSSWEKTLKKVTKQNHSLVVPYICHYWTKRIIHGKETIKAFMPHNEPHRSFKDTYEICQMRKIIKDDLDQTFKKYTKNFESFLTELHNITEDDLYEEFTNLLQKPKQQNDDERDRELAAIFLNREITK